MNNQRLNNENMYTEDDIIPLIEQQYDITITTVISGLEEISSHTEAHEDDDTSILAGLRLYRISQSNNEFYELYCKTCRQTMISFQIAQQAISQFASV